MSWVPVIGVTWLVLAVAAALLIGGAIRLADRTAAEAALDELRFLGEPLISGFPGDLAPGQPLDSPNGGDISARLRLRTVVDLPAPGSTRPPATKESGRA